MTTTQKKPRILVVDDEPAICWMTCEFLLQWNYQPAFATNGPDALELVADLPCDLALIDFKMPGMNGEELATRLKQRHPGMPIIMISGCPPAADIPGVDKLYPKPANPDEIRSFIEESLALDTPFHAMKAQRLSRF